MWAVFALTLVAILCAGVWDLATDQAEQRVKAEQSTKQHIEYAEDRIDEKCLSLEAISMRDCIHEEIESARDHARANQDLYAQQQMAFFTKIMAWTTAGGLFLGVISIVVIYATLAKMGRTNQIMRDEQRPIFAPNGEISHPFGDTMGGQIPPKFDFAFVFRNFGRIPVKVIDAVVEVQRIEIAEGNDHLTGTIRLDDPRSLSQIYLNGQDFVTREKLIHVADFKTHDHHARVKITYSQAIGGDPAATYTVERWGHLRLGYEDGSFRMGGAFDVADVKTIVFIPAQDGLKMS
jgi:hypothetical protein